MSIDLVALAKTLLLIRPSAVLLSVCMGVCGFGWPSSSSVLRMGTSVLAFKSNAPSSSSAAYDITLRVFVDRSGTLLLFGGGYSSLDRKLWSPARLHAFFSDM